MTAEVIRVVIADDEPLIRAGIRMILTSAPDIEVVAEAANGKEAVDLARSHAPDVMLLDIQMPVMDGLSALGELRRAVPEVRALILTTFGEKENVLRALGEGGAGFLLKDSAPGELIGAVRAAAAGDAYLSPGRPGTSWTSWLPGRPPRAGRSPGVRWRSSATGSAVCWRCWARACPTRRRADGCT